MLEDFTRIYRNLISPAKILSSPWVVLTSSSKAYGHEIEKPKQEVRGESEKRKVRPLTRQDFKNLRSAAQNAIEVYSSNVPLEPEPPRIEPPSSQHSLIPEGFGPSAQLNTISNNLKILYGGFANDLNKFRKKLF
eukprot:TRINITY_DN1650_c0_g3_i3.p1 TRINITY_DN1650_c0_g3~~TRINITY_DN1650_c0_g3_i3.p1  ORF type:complete len:135 (+),score=28.23 TRINITY_DN1650_c0_g3_i3:362-766(+)